MNLYSYVQNNPTTLGDPDGHDIGDFLNGAINALVSDNLAGVGRKEQTTDSGKIGASVGDAVAAVQGGYETLTGIGGEGAGILLDSTGAGSVLGVPINVVSAVATVHGGTTAAEGFGHLLKSATSKTGSYTNTHESGMKYHGKGGTTRSQESGKKIEQETGDKHVATEHTGAANDREAFKDESRRLDADGGPNPKRNYNKIKSPGTKYRQQDGDN